MSNINIFEKMRHLNIACLLGALLLVVSSMALACTRRDGGVCIEECMAFAENRLVSAFDEIAYARNNESSESRQRRERKGWGELTNPRNIEPDGSLALVPSKDWTSGFFPGELWYMYEYTGNDFWKQKARIHSAMIEREKDNGGTHDMGFKMYCSYGNGYRLTRDPDYKNILLQSAATLATRFKPKAGIIRSWDHNRNKWQCPVIIDNMMNLELLFWATRETNDSTYYDVAVSHARTTMKNHFRRDNSCYHVVDYDTITGNVIKRNTHQGFADESAWSRGQAWALYGFTMCYRETHLPEFLDMAKKVRDYLFNHPHMPEDLVPYWDFDAPGIPDEPRDASAAAIIASAMYELSMYDRENSVRCVNLADKIVESLTKNYRCESENHHGFILGHSTGTRPTDTEVDVPIVYGDYYYIEALMRKYRLDKTGNVFGLATND